MTGDRTEAQEKAAAAWEKAKKDIERHDREFDEQHGGGQR